MGLFDFSLTLRHLTLQQKSAIFITEVEKMNIKQKVLVACDIAGISMTELGRRLGMSQSAFSQRLKTGKFTQEELENMADILGCKYISVFQFPDGKRVE